MINLTEIKAAGDGRRRLEPVLFVYGPGRQYYKLWGHYIKIYVRGKDGRLAIGVSGVSDYGFYATIDADRYKLPLRLIRRPDVIYYRRYKSNGVIKEHLIFGPFSTASMAIRHTLGYDDNKHLKVKVNPNTPPWKWGVIRVNTLDYEEDLEVYINTATVLGRLIYLLRKL